MVGTVLSLCSLSATHSLILCLPSLSLDITLWHFYKLAMLIEDVTTMSERELMLLHPASYIGAIEAQTTKLWVYQNDEMINRLVTHVPGFLKIFDEVLLINVADSKQRDPLMDSVKVVTDRENKLISVYFNGVGIPVERDHKTGKYLPTMMSGGELTTIIFSDEFTIETSDGKNKYKQVFKNNMKDSDDPLITESSEKWTKVTFKPDMKMFHMNEFEEDVIGLMRKRILEMSFCLGETVNVELNGKPFRISSFTEYVDLYFRSANRSRKEGPLQRMSEKVNDRWEVCVSLTDGQFQQVSFVNGIATTKGGTHVDYVTNQITKYIVGIVNEKNKIANVQTHNVKNHLWVFVNAWIDSPAFESQTKENLILPPSSFGSECELSEGFLKKVAEYGLVDYLLSLATLEQSTKVKKSATGPKQLRVKVEKLVDAHNAGGEKSQGCTLILAEGDSATNLAMVGLSVMGRNNYGVYPLRGKIINVKDSKPKKSTKTKYLITS